MSLSKNPVANIVQHNAVVGIEYAIAALDGKIIEGQNGIEDEYLHGYGNIPPGLERALAGRKVGESFQIVISPEDGFGDIDPDGEFAVPRDELPDNFGIDIGAQFLIERDDGSDHPIWVKNIQDDEVLLSENHPLAGQTLQFSVTVKYIRVATADELKHGHAHGEGYSDHDDLDDHSSCNGHHCHDHSDSDLESEDERNPVLM